MIRSTSRLAIAAVAAVAFAPALKAGHEIAPSPKETKEVFEHREWFPDTPRGYVTFGVQASDHLTGFFVDSVTGLWAPKEQDSLLFLSSRYDWEDNHQYISSTGLGFRTMVTDDVIVGVNVFYDAIHSAGGSEFDQLGLGAEILTRWVDARVNYYLPENEEVVIRRHTWRSRDGGGTRTRVFETRESALEGLNAEIGVLLPFFKNTEVRLYGGYYHYVNPYGPDYDGFKARLEARLLPGVTADVEYWQDAALMGGHWTAGIRVSVPFSIYNLATGRNPFEGISECFTPRSRDLNERLGEMVHRSHRIQTANSGPRVARDSFKKSDDRLGFTGGNFSSGRGFPIE